MQSVIIEYLSGLLTNIEHDSSETLYMSSACWMTRSRSFCWEMDGQREMPPCSSLQSSGMLAVSRLGQSIIAHKLCCMTEENHIHTNVHKLIETHAKMTKTSNILIICSLLDLHSTEPHESILVLN